MDILQQGEFVFNGTVQILLFKNEQETAPFQTAEQSVVFIGPR